MTLAWTDSLKVGVDVIDDDHRDLLEQLAKFPGADDATFVVLFAEVEHHLTEHFERENELMRKHDFFAYHYHYNEHEAVLAEFRALLKSAQNGALNDARHYIDTLIEPWFLNHRNTMDWVTAQAIKGGPACGCSMM